MINNRNTVVFVRHAQSQWNLENRFTGWTDVPLSEHGKSEAGRAGALLSQAGFAFDEVHTSMLTRAHDTFLAIAAELGSPDLPLLKSWRLNERHYGGLQGLNKAETEARYGHRQVHLWRRSYAERPPLLDIDDARHPRFDPRYDDVAVDRLPAGESLEDVHHRILPYWRNVLHPLVLLGHCLLVVSHGNTLRSLLKHLDGLSAEQVEALEIPTGQPLVYRFGRAGEVAERSYLGGARPTPGPGSGLEASAA